MRVKRKATPPVLACVSSPVSLLQSRLSALSSVVVMEKVDVAEAVHLVGVERGERAGNGLCPRPPRNAACRRSGRQARHVGLCWSCWEMGKGGIRLERRVAHGAVADDRRPVPDAGGAAREPAAVDRRQLGRRMPWLGRHDPPDQSVRRGRRHGAHHQWREDRRAGRLDGRGLDPHAGCVLCGRCPGGSSASR